MIIIILYYLIIIMSKPINKFILEWINTNTTYQDKPVQSDWKKLSYKTRANDEPVEKNVTINEDSYFRSGFYVEKKDNKLYFEIRTIEDGRETFSAKCVYLNDEYIEGVVNMYAFGLKRNEKFVKEYFDDIQEELQELNISWDEVE